MDHLSGVEVGEGGCAGRCLRRWDVCRPVRALT